MNTVLELISQQDRTIFLKYGFYKIYLTERLLVVLGKIPTIMYFIYFRAYLFLGVFWLFTSLLTMVHYFFAFGLHIGTGIPQSRPM